MSALPRRLREYRYRGRRKERVLYSADFVTEVHEDGTVSGFSPSNFKDTKRFSEASVEEVI